MKGRTVKHNLIRLILGMGQLGAAFLSFFLLPSMLTFSEDLELILSSFESTLYLRLFFCWCSAWLALSFCVKTILSILFKFFSLIKKMLKSIYTTLFFFVRDHLYSDQIFYVKPTNKSILNIADEEDESTSKGGKSIAKGYRFPITFPRKFKKFGAKLRAFGNLGCENDFNLWGFKIEKRPKTKSTLERNIYKRIAGNIAARKAAIKASKKANLNKKALKKPKSSKSAKPVKTKKNTVIKKISKTKVSKSKNSSFKKNKIKDLLSDTAKKGSKQLKKEREQDQKMAEKTRKKNEPYKLSKTAFKELINSAKRHGKLLARHYPIKNTKPQTEQKAHSSLKIKPPRVGF